MKPRRFPLWSLPVLLIVALVAAVATLLVVRKQNSPIGYAANRVLHLRTLKMDFSIPVAPWRPSDGRFQDFSGLPTLVFYFSPECGHCKTAYRRLRSTRSRFEPRGLKVAAVATGASLPESMSEFDSLLKLDVPTFIDGQRAFSKSYATGTVPLVTLVSSHGMMKQWVIRNAAQLDEVDGELERSFPK